MIGPGRRTLLATSFALLGCEAAEQKCDKAVRAAEAGWTAYVGALQHAHTTARRAEGDAKAKLVGELDRRIGPAAHARADARFQAGSEAWLRGLESAWNELCAADPECAATKQKAADAKAALEDLGDRLTLAHAAHAATHGPLPAAQQAAGAVPVHVEYPQLKAAQALTLEAVEECRDVPARAGAQP